MIGEGEPLSNSGEYICKSMVTENFLELVKEMPTPDTRSTGDIEKTRPGRTSPHHTTVSTLHVQSKENIGSRKSALNY